MHRDFDILVTTYKKNSEEILHLITGLNIDGHIIVRNQCGNATYNENSHNSGVEVINGNDTGLSKNRNELVKKSSAELIYFCDDDVKFLRPYNFVSENKLFDKYDAVVFNAISLNPKRQFKMHKKNKKHVRFFDLSHNGIHGLVIKRSFLIEHNIFFDEKIGSGTSLPCGEDSVFLKKIIKCKAKIYISNVNLVEVKQESSLWYSDTFGQDVLIAKGYCYKQIYGFFWFVFALRFLFINKKNIFCNKPFNFLKKGSKL